MTILKKISKLPIWFWGIIISVCYLLSHILTLTNFPVFADEAIYIRWSQLIVDDWQQYLFFSLNDGKTPVFMWLGTISQLIFSDQLFAGRMVSVLAGLIQLWISAELIKVVGGKRVSQLLAMVFTWLLPYWFFHHHMALHESLMAMFVSLSMLSVFKVLKSKKVYTVWHIMLSLSWGLAILTKLPAVLFLPSIFLPIIWQYWKNKTLLTQKTIEVGVAVIGGFLMFLLLRLNPAFSQLFSRGSDFLFPVKQVLLEGLWLKTIQNIPAYLNYFWNYLTPPLALLMIIGLFSKKHHSKIHLFFWSGLLFILPIALMGRVVFARYLFPAVLLFTPALVLSIESMLFTSREIKSSKAVIITLLVVLFISNGITQAINFNWQFTMNPDQTPFVTSDRHQYLLEWSSGHGIKEVSDKLLKESKDQRILVATEGFFGTLPDGVLLYLHRKDVSNLLVEGVGVPVFGFSDELAAKAENFDQAWILVNSNRRGFKLPNDNLIEEYCRPDPNASCLELWDAKELLANNRPESLDK